MSTPHDAFQKRGGLFVPTGAEDVTEGEELTKRYAEQLVQEINDVVKWAKAWPKVNKDGSRERALLSSDILDTVLSRARAWLWPRDYTEQVHRGAVIALGLVKTQTPDHPQNRQQRRAEGRRDGKRVPSLRAVPTQPPAPQFDPNYPTTEQEAMHGPAVYDEASEKRPAAPFNDRSQPLEPEEKKP